MALNNKPKKSTLENLENKWPKKYRVCPICKNRNFVMTENVYQISRYFPHKLVQGPMVPLIVVTCTNCGYTYLFNALTLDAVKPKS